MTDKIERCGACGNYDAPIELLNSLTPEELEKRTEMGYCGCEEGKEQRYVTRDMAIDAGDRSLEGMLYNG